MDKVTNDTLIKLDNHEIENWKWEQERDIKERCKVLDRGEKELEDLDVRYHSMKRLTGDADEKKKEVMTALSDYTDAVESFFSCKDVGACSDANDTVKSVIHHKKAYDKAFKELAALLEEIKVR